MLSLMHRRLIFDCWSLFTDIEVIIENYFPSVGNIPQFPLVRNHQ